MIASVAAACRQVPTTLGVVATRGNPDDQTTSATALPDRDLCRLPPGVWLITDPAGTVVLGAVVTVPTTSCAFVIAVVAAACARPTTFGRRHTAATRTRRPGPTALLIVTCVPGDWASG